MQPITDPAVANPSTIAPLRQIHIIGAGPVGLFLTALLQTVEGFSVRLYEKRKTYTRSRMVKLSSFLIADSVESYYTDYIDGDNIQAVFEVPEIEETLAFRRTIPSDLMSLLNGWAQGFCPLNAIEMGLSNLIDNRTTKKVERIESNMTAEEAMTLIKPGDILIDCCGTKSLLRDLLVPGPMSGTTDVNTFRIHLEYAIVVTFVFGEHYQCNEYCKYYKNVENQHYKFIPVVDRTWYDGNFTFVSGIVNITTEDFNAMPATFDGQWLRENFPNVSRSMDRFIAKIKQETQGEIVGNIEIVRIPLNLYRARNATNLKWFDEISSNHPLSKSPVFLAGDSTIGSPYFQSISLGLECAIYLTGLLSQSNLPVTEILERYEHYIYKQWLRVYMRSKMIKHNKDLFESMDDPIKTLDLLHIY